MYRFRPGYEMYARTIDDYPAQNRQAAAIMLMIQNNLSPAVAQHPHELITMEMVSEEFSHQAQQVFHNLSAVCRAAGGGLQDCVKLTIYLTDLTNFARVNEVMAEHISEPYPARAAVQVSALPKGAQIEIDAIMVRDP